MTRLNLWIWAHFLRRSVLRRKKPGYPLQFLSPFGASGISALSLALLKNGVHAIFEL
jgi:hypothetical protein